MPQQVVSPHIDNIFTLAPQQEGLVFLSLADSDSSPYIVQHVFRAAGPDGTALDPAAVHTAIRALAARHAILRTAIVTDSVAAPRQVVLKNREPEFEIVDLRDFDEAEAHARIESLLTADVSRGFDLARDPLLRIHAIRTQDARGEQLRLVWTYHHVIMDGWSLTRLFADFHSSYTAALSEPAAAVIAAARAAGAAAFQYSDYVSWTEKRNRPALEAYWRELLADCAPPAPLTSVTDPGEAGDGRVARTTQTGLAARLNRRYAQQGITLSHLAESALAVVLGRMTGTEDVVFGKVVSGRDIDLPGIAETVGLFASTMPVRIRTAAGTPTGELLEAVRQQALASAEHDCGSLARIQQIAEQRELISCLLAVENFALSDEDLDSAGLHFERAREETAYPLTVTVQPLGDELRFIVLYDPAVLRAGDAALFIDRLTTVLDELAEDAAASIGQLSSVPADERAAVRAFEQGPRTQLAAASIPEAFLAAAAEHAERTALRDGAEELSYDQLLARAQAVCAALQRSGVQPGGRVGLLGAPSAALITGMLGIALAGAVYVPLEPEAPAARHSLIFRDAGVRHVVTGHRADVALAARLEEDLPLTVIESHAAGIEAAGTADATAPRLPALGPDSEAYVMYTSGTTGRPKGTVIPHRAVLRLALGNAGLPVASDDRMLLTGSLAFDASTFEIFGTLLNGGTLVIADKDALLDPVELGALITGHGITMMWLTVSLFNHIVSHDVWALTGLRRLLVGGESVSSEHVRRLYAADPEVVIVNGYGPTENTTFTTAFSFPRDFDRVVIGSPIGNTSVRIIAAGGRECGIGEVGEICAGGDGLALGYLNAPEQTAQAFVTTASGTEYRTGDSARWLADGTIEFLGRIDAGEQVKIRGFRVELGEVRAALQQLADISDVVVTVHRPETGAPRLSAYLVSATELDLDAVRQAASERLPSYMVPSSLMQIEAIPLTHSGKLDTASLPVPQTAAAGSGEAPQTDAERAVAEAFAQVLGRADIDRRSSFFESGGDSISAIRVVSALRKAGYHCRVSLIMQAMTVDGIAGQLTHSAQPESLTGTVEGPVGRLPIVEEFLSWDLPVPAHFNQDAVIDVGQATTEHVRAALDTVWAAHGALRSVLADGQLRILPADELRYHFEHRLIPADADAAEELAEFGAQLQSSMDLSAGPLLTAGMLETGTGAQLILCAHHLVVDVVSWHILVEDFVAALRDVRAHRPVGAPAATASLPQWAAALTAYGEQLSPAEQAHWEDVDARLLTCGLQLPIAPDAPGGSRRLNLSASATAALMRAGDMYGAGVEDLLLTALSLTMAENFGTDWIAVQREGHGRSEHAQLPDVTRTVGWFTSLHPVILPADPASLHRSLISTKEAIRRIPLGGIGYSARPGRDLSVRPQIAFNYLGELDGSRPHGTGDFGTMRLHQVGSASAAENRLPFALELNALIRSGQLTLSLSYQDGTLEAATADRLMGCMSQQLDALTAHCLGLEAKVRTSSDFSVSAPLSPDDLSTIESRWETISDIWDLTPLQTGMHFHHVQDPAGGAYTVQQVFATEVLAGLPDAAARLERIHAAAEVLLTRHPVLRSRFASSGLEQPRQIILAPHPADVTAADPGRDLEEIMQQDLDRGFDLAADAPLRITVIDRPEEQLQLLLTYHHIILDGWSLSILLDELLHLLRDPSALPAAPASGARGAAALAKHIAAADTTAADDYWDEVLTGYESDPEFRTAAAWTAAGSDAQLAAEPTAARLRQISDNQLALRLQETFRTAGITLSHAVQAALGVTLGRASGVRDVVLGKVVSGRDFPGADAATGLLINTIPARMRWDPEQTGRSLLDDIRAQAISSTAFEHSSLARIQRRAGNSRLITALFAFENYGIDAQRLEDAGFSFVRSREETNYACTLAAQQHGDELMFVWLYDAAALTAQDMTRISDRVMRILEQLAENPETALGELGAAEAEALPPAEATDRELPESLAAAFLATAAEHSGAVALRDGARALTYRELLKRASAVAASLTRAGVRSGDPVGLIGFRSADAVIGMLGIILSGSCYVPVDAELPHERARLILDDAGVQALVTAGQDGAEFAGALDLGCERIPVGGRAEPADAPPAVGGEDLAYIMYTSGTTGRPKGVEIPQRGVLRIAWENPAIPVDRNDVLLAGSSIAFDASTLEIWAPLLNGGTLVIAPKEQLLDAAALSALIRDCGATVMWLTVSLFNLLIEQDAHVLDGLRSVLIGGEKVSADHVRRLCDGNSRIAVINGYGPTENTTFTTTFEIPHALPANRSVPIGNPLPGTGVHIIDGDGRFCGVGEVGEITATGQGLARGYLGDPELTAARFPVLPTGQTGYRTGDRGQWLSDGTIEFLGRIDDRAQIKVRGFRVEIGEVEATLKALPEVTNAVVVPRTQSDRTTSLAGYLTTDTDLDIRQVRAQLHQSLPDYMVPKHLMVIDAIPVNINGKLDVDALPAPEPSGEDTEEKEAGSLFGLLSSALSDSIEEAIVEIWADVLGTRDLDAADSFFDLGGDSLSIVRVKGQLDRLFPGHVSIGDLFSHPSVSALADAIRRASAPKVVIESTRFDDIAGDTQIAGSIVVPATWTPPARAKVVYAFMLAMGLTTSSEVETVLVREGSTLTVLPLREPPDHTANIAAVAEDLSSTAPIGRGDRLQVEGTGQVVALSLPAAGSGSAPGLEEVDVLVELSPRGAELTLSLRPLTRRADLRGPTVLLTRLATLLEGIFKS